METGDIALDANLPDVWRYLFANRHLSIPDSWQNTMNEFNKELQKIDTWVHTVVRFTQVWKIPGSVSSIK